MCNCGTKTNTFNENLREAYAQKKVFWVNGDNYYLGDENQAIERLRNKDIECYFVPKKDLKGLSFDVKNRIEKPKKGKNGTL